MRAFDGIDEEASSSVQLREGSEGEKSHKDSQLFGLQKIILGLVGRDRNGTPLSSGNGNGEVWTSGRNGRSEKQTPNDGHYGSGLKETTPAGLPRWKRFLDVGLIVGTFICWLPLMTLILGWIRIVSPGPIFYRQQRVGYRGRRFMIFKFRTMQVNADTRTHEEHFARLMEAERPMVKLDAAGDSRLIRGGRFLRASGLDELPQIFNVLRGDMSLVGPRPCLPNEYDRYEEWQRQRFGAVPGLTGYWQVNGKNNTTFKEMIDMDIFYVLNVSILLDLKIMVQTVPTLLREIARTVRRRTARSFKFIIQRERQAAGANGSLNKT